MSDFRRETLNEWTRSDALPEPVYRKDEGNYKYVPDPDDIIAQELWDLLQVIKKRGLPFLDGNQFLILRSWNRLF